MWVQTAEYWWTKLTQGAVHLWGRGPPDVVRVFGPRLEAAQRHVVDSNVWRRVAAARGVCGDGAASPDARIGGRVEVQHWLTLHGPEKNES